MHFYYSYLVMRIGGEHALADAKAGKDGGFKNADLRRSRQAAAGTRRARAVPARLSLDQARRIVGHIRRRQGGDGPDGAMAARHAGAEFDQRQGPGRGGHRDPVVPRRSGRQGQGDRHDRRHQRLAGQQVRAARGGRLPQILQPGEIRQGSGGEGRLYPGRQGLGKRVHRSACSSAWRTISPRRPTTRTSSIRTSGPRSAA